MLNQNPEQIARDRIDEMLRQAGWAVQAKDKLTSMLQKVLPFVNILLP